MTIIAKKYKILDILGNGTFGSIYKAENIRTKELVALKIESLKTETKLLKNETKIYQYLNGIEGIPKVLWFGVDENNNYMAITLLGKSLQQFRYFSNSFSLSIVISITKQMVKRLESIHRKGLIHRDVKPDNFLLGTEKNKNIIYLIDYGFCKKYVLDDGITHMQMRERCKIIGTLNFVSINVHDGYEPSRRDDLESVVYIMLYLISDNNEWKKIVNINENDDDNDNDNEKIKNNKLKIINSDKTPKLLKEFFEYCRGLKFDETPNYEYIYCLLKNI